MLQIIAALSKCDLVDPYAIILHRNIYICLHEYLLHTAIDNLNMHCQYCNSFFIKSTRSTLIKTWLIGLGLFLYTCLEPVTLC